MFPPARLVACGYRGRKVRQLWNRLAYYVLMTYSFGWVLSNLVSSRFTVRRNKQV